MDELTEFERRLAAALVREVGPRRPVDVGSIAAGAKTGTAHGGRQRPHREDGRDTYDLRLTEYKGAS